MVEAGAAAKAHPPRLIGDAPVNDTIGGRAIVLVTRPDMASAAACAVEARSRPLTFRFEDGASSMSKREAPGTAPAKPSSAR